MTSNSPAATGYTGAIDWTVENACGDMLEALGQARATDADYRAWRTDQNEGHILREEFRVFGTR